MKKILVTTGIILVITACSKHPGQDEDYIKADLFLDPPVEYRSAPFWSLNDRLDTTVLSEQIAGFKDAGFGGFFLHSRTGLLTEYLGKEWWDAIDASVAAARQTGLKAWFYDEDKWPSGFAGGKVPLASEEFHSRALIRMDKNDELTKSDTLLFEDNNFRYVCRKTEMGDPWYNGTTWVDLLNPETVKTFIEFSYIPYLERYKDDIGKAAPGIFTDEPQVSPRVSGRYPAVSYSPVIPEKFKEWHGYDIIPELASLFDTVGDFIKIRYDYYQTISRCFEESFSKQIGDINEKAGSVFTGHINGEENFSSVMRNVGNAMITYRHMQMPGIDQLGLNYGTLNSPRSVSSVANQYGIGRRLSEAYGISGHNMNFEDRKWLLDWHTINGINFICPHLSLYSMKGERKRDYPPTFSPAQPYWPYNKLFEDYTGRMCYVTSTGRYAADILVIHPLESEYPGLRNDCYRQYDRCLNTLQRIHRDYDLGDEQIIADKGKIENSNFVVGEMSYKAVILPNMLVIRRSTVDLLSQFKASGGEILVTGMFPEYVDGKPDPDVINSLKQICRLITLNELKDVLGTVFPPVFTLEGTDNDLVWTHHRKVANGGIIQLSNTSRLKSTDCRLSFTTPQKNFALWNPEDGSSMKLQPENDGSIRLHFDAAKTWLVSYGYASKDASFGKLYQIPGEKTEIIKINGNWKGNRADPNSLILDFARYSTDNGETFSDPEPVIGIHQRFRDKRYSGNLLLKYEVQLAEIPPKTALVIEQPQLYTVTINNKNINFEGKDSYLDHTLRALDISGTLEPGMNEIILSLDYVAPEPANLDAYKRYGTEIESIYLTGDFGVEVVRSAEPLTESQKNRSGLFVRKPVHSITRFMITGEKDLFNGDLVLQGYPFYSGTFILKNTFKINDNPEGNAKRYFISFPSFEAVVVKVRINEKEFAPLLYSPWEVDITDAVIGGDNQVEIHLTNSLRNLLGPHHHPGGELYGVGPVSFTGNPGWPSNTGGEPDWYDIRLKGKPRLWSDDYYFIPFGLLEPPVISALLPDQSD